MAAIVAVAVAAITVAAITVAANAAIAVAVAAVVAVAAITVAAVATDMAIAVVAVNYMLVLIIFYFKVSGSKMTPPFDGEDSVEISLITNVEIFLNIPTTFR